MADNFQMPFFNTSGQQNPIHQFEVSRANYLFGNATIVNMMNDKKDPRRAKYFTTFPLYSGLYKGSPVPIFKAILNSPGCSPI